MVLVKIFVSSFCHRVILSQDLKQGKKCANRTNVQFNSHFKNASEFLLLLSFCYGQHSFYSQSLIPLQPFIIFSRNLQNLMQYAWPHHLDCFASFGYLTLYKMVRFLYKTCCVVYVARGS